MKRMGLWASAGVVCFLVFHGCGGGGDSGGTAGPTPSISLTLNKSSLTIVQGGNDNLVASVTRSVGFSGDVSVTVEGIPAGVTGALSNITTTGATVTVNVAVSVAPGSYNVVVRASGPGVTSVTATATLTVTAIPAIGIALSSATPGVNQGASGQVTVTINRTNYTGNVSFALEGAPNGVTGTFAPAPAPGTTSTLTIQVGAAVAAATYPLTVRATGDGITATTAPLALTVTTPGTSCFRPVILTEAFESSDPFTIGSFITSSGATQAATRVTTGGNPGGYRQMTHMLPPMGTIRVDHLFATAYSPTTQGRIDHLEYSEDRIKLSPQAATEVVGGAFALSQNGIARQAVIAGVANFNSLTWEHAQATFTQSQFSQISFAAGAPDIQFGYSRSNANPSTTATITTVHGIDNWQVRICRDP